MKNLAVILAVYLSFSAFAQKEPLPLMAGSASVFLPDAKEYIEVKRGATENEIIEIIKASAGYGPDISLNIVHNTSSKIYDHYHFQIYKDGIRVFGNKVHAAIDKSSEVSFIQFPVLPAFNSGSIPGIAAAESVKNIISAEKVDNAEVVWFYNEGEYLIPALSVELSGPETLHRQVIYYNNEIVYQADLHKYHHHTAGGPDDTLVSVRVFDPDPLTSAQVSYGFPFIDDNDNPVPVINAHRKLRSTTFTYKNGQIIAENDFLKVADFSPPFIAPVTSTTDKLYFSRDSASFEDVNVMYHITQHSHHMLTIGYTNLPGYQIEVDPHAISGSDQSFFSTAGGLYRLYFGEGGVDDAEDADVILHEYSHAIIYAASPSMSISTERACIEESLCDYFAASYSRTVNSFNPDEVFNWDSGGGTFWPGRTVASNKDYAMLSFKNGNYYSNTDIIASCLMEIYDNIGRDAADELVFESIYNLTTTTTMPEFAGYMLLSDSAMNGGFNSQIIRNAFFQRNILPVILSSKEETLSQQSSIQLFNTYGFSKGGDLILKAESPLNSYQVFSSDGRLVAQADLDRQYRCNLSLPALNTGVFILRVLTQDGKERNFKISRINP